MRRTLALVVALFVVGVNTSYALYELVGRGAWPETWPKEFEPLRDRSETFVGPTLAQRHYAIPFTDRDAFEALWPMILERRTPGVPIVLRRSSFFLGDAKAGVSIHTPPKGTEPVSDVKSFRWKSNYIEVVVDGDVVDLNRIKLPADTPIIDLRFEKNDQ